MYIVWRLLTNVLNHEIHLDISLVTPPESAHAIEAALGRDRYLSSLITHKIEVIAPEKLTLTTGTAEIFRLPEVTAAVKGDFLLLPCDLVCELDGRSLLKEWMVQQTGVNGGERSNQKGGLSVWYATKNMESVKGDEADFIITSELPRPIVRPPSESLVAHIHKLVLSLSSDTLEEKLSSGDLRLRQSLFQKHAKLNVCTEYKDAHIYFFPYWTLTLTKNDRFDSVSEDILGWWAKASWQKGLYRKLGVGHVFEDKVSSSGESKNLRSHDFKFNNNVSSIEALSSTYDGGYEKPTSANDTSQKLASRVNSQLDTLIDPADALSEPLLPPMLAYVQPEQTASLIRRVDNTQRLLAVSLRLAKLPAKNELSENISPFAHDTKIVNPDNIPQRCTVQSSDTLLAEMVEIEEKVNIKESVIGPGCRIGEGARLLRCLLMEGAIVGPNCQLTGCILGRRCKIEGGPARDSSKTNLKECEIQEGYIVEPGSKFSVRYVQYTSY